MTDDAADREAQLDALLDSLLALEPAARAAWLQANCADPELRAKACEILAASEQPGLIDRVRARLVADEELPGNGEIAGYTLIRKIGAGGMATVYLAERSVGQATQRVALKLMRAGLY